MPAALRALSCLTLLALLIGMAACRSTDPPPPAGYGDSYPAPLNDPQISVLAADLREWLRFQPAVVVNEPDRPLEVQVPVRSIASRQYLIDYRFLFYDRHGAETPPTMSWAPATLLPGQVVRLRANALDDRAESYRLEINWAQ